MNRDLLHVRPFQIACGAGALALALAVWALTRAVQIVPVAEAAPPMFATAAATAKLEPRGVYDASAVVALDVFAPERSAPARRYKLGGYAAEAPKASPPPQPLVLGTVVDDDPARSFTICRVAGGPSIVVRVGGKIGEFTVVSIARSQVVFAGPDGVRVTLNAATR